MRTFGRWLLVMLTGCVLLAWIGADFRADEHDQATVLPAPERPHSQAVPAQASSPGRSLGPDGPSGTGRHAASVARLDLPLDAPLSAVYAELRQRAERGDPIASCRLSIETALCNARVDADRSLGRHVDRAAATDPGSSDEQGAVRAAQALESDIGAQPRLCAGWPIRQHQRAWRYVYYAAMRGDVPSILAFTINPPLDEARFVEDLDGWQAYRDHAIGLLRTAARKGSPEAVYWLAWNYAGYPVAGGSPLVDPDPVKAAAYALVARRFADPQSARQLDHMLESLQQIMQPDGMQRAQTLADRLKAGMGSRSGYSNGDFINGLVMQPGDCYGEDVGARAIRSPAQRRASE